MSVLVPVLEKVMNRGSAKIRRFFASRGLALLEWEKMRKDILTIRTLPCQWPLRLTPPSNLKSTPTNRRHMTFRVQKAGRMLS
jgi:hypothetical protein